MDDDDLLSALARLPRHDGALQKLCDAEDWADPAFRLVVRRGLGRAPRIHPRQWEMTAALLALAEGDALRSDARGIAFGSGREPLTFAVASRVAHLTATDLYDSGTAWAVARTADPRAFVLAGAPPGFDAERLGVHAMDMRSVAYPDASFDFAYSISAFEHIGDDPDFVAHLAEVRRVLKPGGLYALTTEVLLGPETRRTRGNYAFAADHLLRLCAEAGMQAAPVLHMEQSDWQENTPRPLTALLHEDPAEPLLQGLALRELGGAVSGPALLLLRPASGPLRPVAIRGLEATRARAEAQRRQLRRMRFADWVRLNPFAQRPARARQVLDLWADTPAPGGPQPILATPFLEVGEGRFEAQVVLVPSPGQAAPARLSLRALVRRGAGQPREAHAAPLVLNTPPGAPLVHRFAVPLAEGDAVALFCHATEGAVLFASVDVQVRRVG